MAANPPQLLEQVDLVLHMGSGKTGTSSIQRFLHRNRAALANLGHLYPRSPGRTRHTKLGVFIRPDDELTGRLAWHRQNASDPTAFRRMFRRRLFKEINESGLSHVLMSDEGLYDSSHRALGRLRTFTDRIAKSVRLVVYLRRQDDHLVSNYQQRVKVGEVRRIGEWAKRDFAAYYDYHAKLRGWQEHLDPDDFVVRRFEPASFVDGSLYQDFLDAAGIAGRASAMRQLKTTNESLSAEAVEFLRLINIHRIDAEGAKAGYLDNRSLLARLSGASNGPVLTLPASWLDAFMARWETSNRAVALEFIGDPGGELFRMPRKSSNTTTEQRLDPARVDHFVDLLALPEDWRSPLRQLAEREAKVRPSHH